MSCQKCGQMLARGNVCRVRSGKCLRGGMCVVSEVCANACAGEARSLNDKGCRKRRAGSVEKVSTSSILFAS